MGPAVVRQRRPARPTRAVPLWQHNHGSADRMSGQFLLYHDKTKQCTEKIAATLNRRAETSLAGNAIVIKASIETALE